MEHNPALAEWELHTLKDMGWNHNQQGPIERWSRDIIGNIRLLMLQRAYPEHFICARQHCFHTSAPTKRHNTDMPIVGSWWEKPVR